MDHQLLALPRKMRCIELLRFVEYVHVTDVRDAPTDRTTDSLTHPHSRNDQRISSVSSCHDEAISPRERAKSE